MGDSITIYSIAEETGVSAATVSRVLNNNPHVKKDTREKVLKALNKNGYVPNDTARNLVTKSSMMIGILVSDIRETQQSNTLYTIEQEFMKNGYSCLIYITGMDPKGLKTYTKLLSQKKVDGVILIGSNYQTDEMKEALSSYFSRIPVIVLNGKMEGENVYNIYCDVRTGLCQSIDMLIGKGRRCIGLVYAEENPGIKKVGTGVLDEYCARHKGNVEFFSCRTNRRPEEIVECVSAILKEHPEVDGLIFADDYLAMGGMRGLADFGKKVPEDVSVMGIGNSRYTRIANPRLTSLDIMLHDCALTSVRTMLPALKGERIPKSILMQAVLVEREST